MEKESSTVNPSVQIGRPSIKVDFAIVLRMRDVEHLGWTLIANKYQELTGQYISRDTVQRAYKAAKAIQIIKAATHRSIFVPTDEKPQRIFEPVDGNPRIVEISGKKWVMTKKRPGHTVSKPPKPIRQTQSQLRLFQ